MLVGSKSAYMDPRVTLNHVKTSWEVEAKEHLLACLIHKMKCCFYVSIPVTCWVIMGNQYGRQSMISWIKKQWKNECVGPILGF